LSDYLGYALGVGMGTLVGVFLDERLSAGQSEAESFAKVETLLL
jgi:uncharacterized protein YebE (UPF0316 family)